MAFGRRCITRYYGVELDVSYEVALAGDALVLRRRKFEYREMEPAGDDPFEAGGRYRFTRDVTGRVDGFEVSTGRVRNLRFERVE